MKNIIRKSKWILGLVILKIVLIFISIAFIMLFFIFLAKHFSEPLRHPILIITYFLCIWGYFSSILSISKYFFDVLIVNDKIVYKFKIGLIFNEDISMVELYRIQEIKSDTNGFIKILLNIGDIHLVEQKDSEKIIHNLDNPERIAKFIENKKENLIKSRPY